MEITRRDFNKMLFGAAGIAALEGCGTPSQGTAAGGVWVNDVKVPRQYEQGVSEAMLAAGGNARSLAAAVESFKGDSAKLAAICDSVKETANRYFWEYRELPNESWSEIPKERLDAREITAKSLIDNTNYAFKALERFPWAVDAYQRGAFLEQMHPYRIGTTPIEHFPDGVHWRQPFFEKDAWEHVRGKGVINTGYETVKKNLDKFAIEYEKAGSIEAKREVLKKVVTFLDIDVGKNAEGFFYKARGPNEQTLCQTYERKAGRCTDLVNLQNLWLRSIGIPATFIRIIAWGRGSDNHRISDVDALGEHLYMDPLNNEKAHGDYFRASKNIRSGAGAKVYREKWGDWTGASADVKCAFERGEAVPRAVKFYLGTRSMQDVTRQHSLAATDIEVEAERGKMAYLGIINSMNDAGDGWTSVAAARADRNGKAVFKDVCSSEPGIIYLPFTYSETNGKGSYKAIGKPIRASGSGKKALGESAPVEYDKDITVKYMPAGWEGSLEAFDNGRFAGKGKVKTAPEGTLVINPKQYKMSAGAMYLLRNGESFSRPFVLERSAEGYEAINL